jgi:hypothetical protein
VIRQKRSSWDGDYICRLFWRVFFFSFLFILDFIFASFVALQPSTALQQPGDFSLRAKALEVFSLYSCQSSPSLPTSESSNLSQFIEVKAFFIWKENRKC